MTAAAPRWAEAGEMASPGSDPDANLRGAGRKPWLARRARRLRKLWGRVLVLRARRRLHAALSPAERKALRRLRIGAAPMALSPLHHFDGGGYKFQIYCAMLGVRLEPWSVWGAYDVVINWQDVTRDAMDVRAYAETCAQEHDRPDCLPDLWLSAGPIDISKSAVEAAHLEAFGYGAAVDPLTHRGRMVEKSDVNGRHDARLLTGPIPAEEMREDRVYRRFIDTTDGDHVVDFRTIFVRGVGPLVMEKRFLAENRMKSRFHGGLQERILHLPEDVYSPEELAALNRFLELMGLDQGELDVLRDKADGRIYVVDCNRTTAPTSSPLSMAKEAEIYETVARRLLDKVLLPLIRGRLQG